MTNGEILKDIRRERHKKSALGQISMFEGES